MLSVASATQTLTTKGVYDSAAPGQETIYQPSYGEGGSISKALFLFSECFKC